MAKTYRIAYQIISAQAEAANKRVSDGLIKADVAAGRLAAGLDKVYRAPPGAAAALQRIDAQTLAIRAQTTALNELAVAQQRVSPSRSSGSRQAGQAGQQRVAPSAAGTAPPGQQAAQRQVSEKGRTADQLQAIEYTCLKREYDCMMRHEARQQTAAERAASQAVSQKAKTADQLQGLEDRYLMREQSTRNKYQARQETAAEKAASQKVKAKAKADADLSALEDRYLLREQDGRAKYESRQMIRAERAAAMEVKQKERTAAELQKIEDRYLRKEYDQRVAYVRRKAELQEQEGAKSLASMMHFGKVAATMAVTAAGAGLKMYFDGFHQITEESKAATQAVLKLRNALGIEAGLKGHGQADNEILAESIKLRAATGLDQGEASALTKQYLGAVPAALESKDVAGNPNITPDVSKGIMRETGIIQKRIGGGVGADTRGTLAGLLAEHRPVKSVEEGLGIQEAIRFALTEGIGDDTPLSQAFLGARGALVSEKGMVPSDPELAALIGTASLQADSPRQSDQVALSLARFTRGTGLGGMHAIQKSFGVKETDKLEARLDKIVPKLRAMEKAGRSVPEYLIEGKMTENSQDANTIVAFMKNYEVFKSRLARARDMEKTAGPKVKALNDAFLKSAQGRDAVNDAQRAAAEITKGVEHRGEDWQTLVAGKEHSPEMQQASKSTATQWGDRLLRGVSEGGWIEHGKTVRMSEAVLNDLEMEAQRVGARPKPFSARGMANMALDSAIPLGLGGMFRSQVLGDRTVRRNTLWDPDARQKDAAGLMEDIQAKGGNINAGYDADLKATMGKMDTTLGKTDTTLGKTDTTLGKLNSTLGKLVEILARQTGIAPTPLPGPPPGGPFRN